MFVDGNTSILNFVWGFLILFLYIGIPAVIILFVLRWRRSTADTNREIKAIKDLLQESISLQKEMNKLLREQRQSD
ncbi:MAG TPA: hypothetical protein VFZ76_11580 [Anaerolineales bacterium]